MLSFPAHCNDGSRKAKRNDLDPMKPCYKSLFYISARDSVFSNDLYSSAMRRQLLDQLTQLPHTQKHTELAPSPCNRGRGYGHLFVFNMHHVDMTVQHSTSTFCLGRKPRGPEMSRMAQNHRPANSTTSASRVAWSKPDPGPYLTRESPQRLHTDTRTTQHTYIHAFILTRHETMLGTSGHRET